MEDSIVYALCVFAFFIAVGIFSRWLEQRSDATAEFEEPPFVALRSPSRTNAFDRRIEVALRDASRGFRLCTKCLFTNRARAETCVLCGLTLSDDEPPQSDTQLTQRQQRARTRKEWTRCVNEDDNVVWSRSGALGALPFTYYVYDVSAFTRSDDLTVKDGHALNHPAEDPPAADGEVRVTVDEESEKPTNATLHSVGAELHAQASAATVELLPVTHGSPAPLRVRLDRTPTTPADWKDAVRNAASDFPTKLAQFVTSTSTVFLSAALKDDGTTRLTRLSIRRNELVATSVDALATLTRDHARAVVRVEFAGEQGVDAGGIYREWFVLLNERILAPEAGVFTCVDPQHQVYYLNPHSREILGDDHLAYFLAVGRLVGRALLEGNVTGLHLALPLLKIILGLPVGFPDLEYYDPELFSNLQWLLETDDAESLGLDFAVVEKLPDATIRVVELLPNGHALDVTNGNKRDFVDRKLQYLLFTRVQPQLFAFLKGLYDVVPPTLLALLDAEELDHLVAGSDDINVDDWERSSQSSGNLLLHPALPNFWRVVREFTLEERRRLLQFSTGATRVPPGGFSALTSYDGRQCAFTLHGVAVWRSRGYLRSHACFNRLDLPLHFDLATMRRAVAAAIAVDSFGFTAV